MSPEAKKIWDELDDALIHLNEARDLLDLLWLAAGNISRDDRDPIQAGANTVRERMNRVKEFIEKAIESCKAGAA